MSSQAATNMYAHVLIGGMGKSIEGSKKAKKAKDDSDDSDLLRGERNMMLSPSRGMGRV